MARTSVRLLYAALLALLSAQTAIRPVPVTTEYQANSPSVAARNQSQQKMPRDPHRDRIAARITHPASTPYVSFSQAEPETILHYQLPPPVFSIAS
jgi:hypothetical protein